jgi:DHA3 family macrolide efflux protein-like MFS transporter
MSENAGRFGTFVAVWFAELLSMTGTAMTGFALGVWVYRETGSATQFAAIVLVLFAPQVLITAVSGMLADRYSRRHLMLAANVSAVLVAAGLTAVVVADALSVAAVYGFTLLFGVCTSVAFPAFAASVALLVPERQLGRANGMVQMAHASSRMIAPALAAMLLPLVDIAGIAVIDLATFGYSAATLAIVRIPQPAASAALAGIRRMLRELGAGWAFIAASPGLLRLLGFSAVANIAGAFTIALLPPLVLDFASTSDLGLVLSIEGVGWLLGAILMIVWGGPKRRIHGVLIPGIAFGVGIALLGFDAAILLVSVGVFVYAVSLPIINACDAAIWQAKVPPEIQGRAFGTLQMVALASVPISAIAAGGLADAVFEPLLMPGGALAGSVGTVIGTGPGRGTALVLILVGLVPVLAAAMAYRSRPVLEVEDDPPVPANATTAEQEG